MSDSQAMSARFGLLALIRGKLKFLQSLVDVSGHRVSYSDQINKQPSLHSTHSHSHTVLRRGFQHTLDDTT